MAENVRALGKVLVLDSDTTQAHEMGRRLRYLNYEPVIVDDLDKHRDLVKDPGIAVILGQLSRQDMRDAFHQIVASRPDIPVLLYNCNLEDAGLNADLAGRPTWRLDAPVRRTQLARLMRRAERHEYRQRRQQITGHSLLIQRVRELIEQVADHDTSVLVTGESGTGKELVARTIHDLSRRAGQPFVPINCGAIPPDLLESELFGHEKGAFTGAVSARTGRFELAHGGTLFLDEIGDMSLPMQVKLLRVLQERCFERVGSNKSLKCDVRIVAATHVNLTEAVENGVFREDLYYRLNVFPIEMPPLRKRATDLPQLLDELIVQHAGDDASAMRVSAAALAALAKYPWPGNIRELSNLVERLAILYPSGEIGLDKLPTKYHSASEQSVAASSDAALDQFTMNASSLKLHLQDIEQSVIRTAMRESEGVVAKAARLLNMRRTTLVEKLAKYKLDRNESGSADDSSDRG